MLRYDPIVFKDRNYSYFWAFPLHLVIIAAIFLPEMSQLGADVVIFLFPIAFVVAAQACFRQRVAKPWDTLFTVVLAPAMAIWMINVVIRTLLSACGWLR